MRPPMMYSLIDGNVMVDAKFKFCGKSHIEAGFNACLDISYFLVSNNNITRRYILAYIR